MIWKDKIPYTLIVKKRGTMKEKKKITAKQIIAIIGIILLVLLYVITLILAFVDTSASGRMFAVSLCCSFILPVLIWFYTWLYDRITNRESTTDNAVNTDTK